MTVRKAANDGTQMTWKHASRTLVAIAALSAGAAGIAQTKKAPAPVDTARLRNQAPSDWLMDGRSYDASRFSPLTQVSANNVDKLGLAWFDELDTYRGVEATPLYADGVLY